MNRPASVTIPKEVSEAVSLLRSLGEEGRPIAGGTDLVVRMKNGLLPPGHHLVDLNRLDPLKKIEMTGRGLFIGALATHSQIADSRLVRENASVLCQACRSVGSVQIRNRGTIGGNLANASPAGDSIPALYVLEAMVVIVSSEGERQVPVEQFFTGPGKTILAPGELIKGVIIPRRPEGERVTFIKLGQRNALAISIINLAAAAILSEGAKGEAPGGQVFESIRLAYGAVAPTVIRARRTEEILTGARLTGEKIEEAMRAACQEVSPISDIRASAEYRRDMAGALLYQAIWKLRNQPGDQTT